MFHVDSQQYQQRVGIPRNPENFLPSESLK
jgi:hypothetical protein